MLITLSWISIVLLLILFFLAIAGDLRKYRVLATIMLAFSILFFAIDYQVSELQVEVMKVGVIEQNHEYCDITAISSDCYVNKTAYFDMNNSQVEKYVAFRNTQEDVLSTITPITSGLGILALVYLLWGWFKKDGWVK